MYRGETNDRRRSPVHILSRASVHTSSGSSINGARIYALGGIELTAKADGIEGIAAYAGGGIHLTTDGSMSGVHCNPGGGGSTEFSYALVD